MKFQCSGLTDCSADCSMKQNVEINYILPDSSEFSRDYRMEIYCCCYFRTVCGVFRFFFSENTSLAVNDRSFRPRNTVSSSLVHIVPDAVIALSVPHVAM